ncbi:ComEC/Rec2 family competence protein [Marinifilum sp.]|uniref:ComEC/Rec2 family competence protein n=1 Tax=Marinifilum sp. TaxID=2033137 RepID=UPI003BA9B196
MYKLIGFMILLCFGFKGKSQEFLPKWQNGYLDIHHIQTGRGNATFVVFPDATSLLIDCGDMSESHSRVLSDRNTQLVPNNSKTAPQWVVDYVKQFQPNRSNYIDYALITHYHDDHFGEMDNQRKKSAKGDFFLTGITEFGDAIPIKTIIDRGFEYPINLKDKSVQNQADFKHDKYKMIPTLREYWKFIDHCSKSNGLKYEEFELGSKKQISLQNEASRFTNCYVQNLAVNGRIWTGIPDETISLYQAGIYPGENSLSTCLKIVYGKFEYFTGADISGVNDFGEADFNSMESHLAPVIGAVDVATLNHHGNKDSSNKYYIRTIRPRVWISQAWSSNHPGHEVFKRIRSKQIYPGERDIYSTTVLAASKNFMGVDEGEFASEHGHIVVRVYQNGEKYEVYVLDEKDVKRKVIMKKEYNSR